jgi:hypothetical protein
MKLSFLFSGCGTSEDEDNLTREHELTMPLYGCGRLQDLITVSSSSYRKPSRATKLAITNERYAHRHMHIGTRLVGSFTNTTATTQRNFPYLCCIQHQTIRDIYSDNIPITAKGLDNTRLGYRHIAW